MTPADLARLHAVSFTTPRPWTEAEFATLVAAPSTILLAEAQGFALGRTVLDEAELLTIATEPAARRQGVGRRLLDRWHEAAGQAGAVRALLEVAGDNGPAIAFYRGAGYRDAGVRRGYYRTPEGDRRDAILMTLPLPPAERPAAAQDRGDRRGI